MFISLAAFTVYGALGYQLTAAIAFPALSLFNLLRFPLMMLPEQILNLIQVCSCSELDYDFHAFTYIKSWMT